MLVGLEFMLNFIQALIFSVLTLMFIVLAIESHDEEEGRARSRGDRKPRASESAAASRPQPQPTSDPSRWPGSRRNNSMEHIGAGLAALGVFGPGIGIGILAGLASPRDRAQP